MAERTVHEQTLYEVLGIGVEARSEVVRKAWRLALSRHHPDRVAHLGPDPEAMAAARSADINHAYWVLSDPGRRASYDLQAGVRSAPCSWCGKPGRLRGYGDGTARGACDPCWQRAGSSQGWARPHSAGDG